MNQLINGLAKQANKTTTLNGAKAVVSTKQAVLDLFAGIGGMRGRDSLQMYIKALHENAELALRCALWSRDVRQGAGERQAFRTFLRNLATNDYKLAQQIIHKVPELGRWDDLLVTFDTPVWVDTCKLIQQALKDGHGLCAKWMPRKGSIAVSLTKFMGLTPKQYRKLLVGLTKVVEQQMCAKEWAKIEYHTVPSKAAQIYSNAFKSHDPDGYSNYKNKLIKGEAKINAGALYPYEVMAMIHKDEVIANAQWKALPDFVPENLSFLPIIDSSGSMGSLENKTDPISIAVGLGLYLSERNKSVFKDSFITFSEQPTFQQVTGTLSNRVKQMSTAKWGMSTNIQAVFDLVLNTAIKHKVKQQDMPTHMIIVSDMQFNKCCKSNNNRKEIVNKYKQCGYDAPILVFWNVQHCGNFAAKKDTEDTILVSGFSPAIMKTILNDNTESITPYNQMLKTLMQERYNYAN